MGPEDELVDYTFYPTVEGIFGNNPPCGHEELAEDPGGTWNKILATKHPSPLVEVDFSSSRFFSSPPADATLSEEPFYPTAGVPHLQEGLLGGLPEIGDSGLLADLRRDESFSDGGLVGGGVKNSGEGFVSRAIRGTGTLWLPELDHPRTPAHWWI